MCVYMHVANFVETMLASNVHCCTMIIKCVKMMCGWVQWDFTSKRIIGI